MKPSISLLTTLALLAGIANAATPVVEQRTWQERYAVQTDSPQLTISNIWGNVRVRPGTGGQIVVSTTQLRSAPDQASFEQSLKVLELRIESDSNGVSIRVGDADTHRNTHERCDGCRLDVQFDIVAPPGTLVDASTVMDGRIDIREIAGRVTASNVNGPIKVHDIQNCGAVESVNGGVELGFSRPPTANCTIATINGDITLDIPANTGMDVALDLFNGEVLSELQVAGIDLPASVEHSTEGDRNRYRIRKLTGLRIGAGGPTYSISSTNGDVRIQKHR